MEVGSQLEKRKMDDAIVDIDGVISTATSWGERFLCIVPVSSSVATDGIVEVSVHMMLTQL